MKILNRTIEEQSGTVDDMFLRLFLGSLLIKNMFYYQIIHSL